MRDRVRQRHIPRGGMLIFSWEKGVERERGQEGEAPHTSGISMLTREVSSEQAIIEVELEAL